MAAAYERIALGGGSALLPVVRKREREERLRLRLLAALAALAALVVVPVAVGAGNAHFIKSATSATLSGANLVCKLKEAGLAAGSTETVTCTATQTIVYECVNKGGKNPAASNKKTFQTTVSKTGSFTADRSGNIVGSLTLSPASAASLGFSCPSGQTVTLVSVTYSNVTVVDSTSGASISIPGTFTYTNPAAPPVR